jgi:hypothetical protein
VPRHGARELGEGIVAADVLAQWQHAFAAPLEAGAAHRVRQLVDRLPPPAGAFGGQRAIAGFKVDGRQLAYPDADDPNA